MNLVSPGIPVYGCFGISCRFCCAKPRVLIFKEAGQNPVTDAWEQMSASVARGVEDRSQQQKPGSSSANNDNHTSPQKTLVIGL